MPTSRTRPCGCLPVRVRPFHRRQRLPCQPAHHPRAASAMRAPAPLTSHGTIPRPSATQTRPSCFRAEHSPATVSVTVSPTVRNSTIHGCAYQGGGAGSGTAGGSVWNYQGSGAAFVIGDPGDGSDTPGFYLTDLTLATANGGSSARAIDFHRVQEIDIERVYSSATTAPDRPASHWTAPATTAAEPSRASACPTSAPRSS